MSNYDYSYLTTRELLEKALNGELPIPRNNPKQGESKYFFMKTGADPYASINDAEVFDVPDDEDPFEFRDNGYSTSTTPPVEKLNNPNWGSKTAEALNNYLLNMNNNYPGKVNTGVFAPFKDMLRNYNEMRDLNLLESDNFFHCKANYEAAKRGAWGELVAKTLSLGREAWGLGTGDSLTDSLKDWNANQMGWTGAKQGLRLEESCPIDPREYYKLFKNF